MVLSPNLHHKEGYLLRHRGSVLDEIIINRLREFECINGELMTLFNRIESR